MPFRRIRGVTSLTASTSPQVSTMPNTEGFPGPAVSPVGRKENPRWTSDLQWLRDAPWEVRSGLPSWASLGKPRELKNWGNQIDIEKGVGLTVTIAQISVDCVLIWHRTWADIPASSFVHRQSWPRGPTSPGISIGSSAWFKSPAKGLYCHGAHPMAHLGKGTGLQSHPTAKHSFQFCPTRKHGHRCPAAHSMTCLGREPSQRPCPIVEHSLWPCIIKKPEQYPEEAQSSTYSNT